MLEDDTWEVVVGKLVNSSTCQSPANNTKEKQRTTCERPQRWGVKKGAKS